MYIAAGAAQKKFNKVFKEKPDLLKKWGLMKGEQVLIEVDPATMASAKKGVFAGGDVVRGRTMVKRRRAK
jgi:pyruvate/2-oxoglutarate dehydrogenase complex dihydrolipoamide dehydrogenase (E3) component